MSPKRRTWGFVLIVLVVVVWGVWIAVRCLFSVLIYLDRVLTRDCLMVLVERQRQRGRRRGNIVRYILLGTVPVQDWKRIG